MPPKKRARVEEDGGTATAVEAEEISEDTVKSEPPHRQEGSRSSFTLQFKGENNKHLMYEMFIKDREESDSLFVVDYKYGIFGTNGKSYIKCFTEENKAEEFITNKYNELWDKGYREDALGKSVVLLEKPGDLVYLEHHEVYSGDKSFYELELSKCGKYVITREGDVDGKGRIGSFPVEDDVAEVVAALVNDHTRRHYKKKPRPKFMETFKFINDCTSESEGDERDESEDEM